jgi:group I intron endonuclease
MIVYKTTCLINGKIYIGKACGSNKRKGYLGSGKSFKCALSKYGKENFKKVTIDVAENKEEQKLKEVFWIKFYDSTNPLIGYNITRGGDGFGVAEDNPMYGKTGEKSPNFGSCRSEETKLKMSVAKIGENNHFYGKHHSNKTIQNISISRKKYWDKKRHDDVSI